MLHSFFARLRAPSVADFLDAETFEARLRWNPDLRNSTVENYVRRVKKFRLWCVSQKLSKLHRIEPRDIKNYRSHLLELGLKKTSVQGHLSTLHLVFDLAIEDELIKANPATGVTISAPSRKVETLPEFQVAQMVLNFEGEPRDIFITSFYLALRNGEVANLRWEDLDFPRKLVRIQSREKHPGVEEWRPKSQSSERVLPMTEVVHSMVTDRYDRVGQRSPYLFFNRTGGRKSTRTILRTFQAECERVGIKPINGHPPTLRLLRPTQLSLLAHSMMPYELAAYAGHSDPSVTAQHYIDIKVENFRAKVEEAHRGPAQQRALKS